MVGAQLLREHPEPSGCCEDGFVTPQGECSNPSRYLLLFLRTFFNSIFLMAEYIAASESIISMTSFFF
jgi:hypothetical protein